MSNVIVLLCRYLVKQSLVASSKVKSDVGKLAWITSSMSVCVDQPCGDPYFSKQTETEQNSLAVKISKRLASADKFFSLEFYPPRTRSGTCNLLEKCDRFVEGDPLFCDVTCDLKNGDHDETTNNNSLTLATATQELCGVETMLQLNCSSLTEHKALEMLQQAKSVGLRNILAVKEGSFFLLYQHMCIKFTVLCS